MMNATDTAKKKQKVRLIALVGVGLIAVGLGVVLLTLPSSAAGSEAVPTFEVKEGPLTIAVSEAGTIQALEQVIIKSEVEGQTTIIDLIPEGTLVEAGELLVELDASGLEDDLIQQEISVQNAEAAFVRARENLKVVQNQAKSDISKAKLDWEFAKEDLKKYMAPEGEYQQQKREAESKIQLASEEFQRAKDKLAWSERLFEEKYLSQTELEADQLAKNRAELDYELAKAALKLLETWTHARQVAQLTSDIDQAELALERVQLKAKADIVQAQAELTAKEAEYKQQQTKLDKVKEQIAKTKIRAPRAGLVVYATSAKSSWRGNDEPLDEGQTVREREELIYLPTADAMMAQIQIHESNLDKVRIGLPVRVTVDALPEQVYTGRIAKIAPLPNAHVMRRNPDLKVYLTEVHLDGSNTELRTGMSCNAEVIIEQLADAVYVPVQSVVRAGSGHVAYVKRGNEFVRTPVEIGRDDNRMLHVRAGLEPGELVSLAPPLEPAEFEDYSGPQLDDTQREKFQAAIEASKNVPARPRGRADNRLAADQSASATAQESADGSKTTHKVRETDGRPQTSHGGGQAAGGQGEPGEE
jgi:HlyD family secretion protein